MAMLVMTVIIVASFLSVEARLTSNQHLAIRAKLNSVVALRLALGHLQQEAGPDRRATARADITQPGTAAAGLRNPVWTGVWRTDRPNQPPSWLVSGKDSTYAGGQSVSLSGADLLPTTSAYPTATWLPWETDYGSALPSSDSLVTLVGIASASWAETRLPNDAVGDKPSGIVVVPKLEIRENDGAGYRVNGRYAYWIGDEGIKARINLTDPRSTSSAGSAGNLAAMRSPLSPALELLSGFTSLSTNADFQKLNTNRDLLLLSNSPSLGSTQRLFHDITTNASGVIADSYNGGLKRDLSLAFELSDAEFTKTEFGSSFDANVTSTENGFTIERMQIPLSGNIIQVAPVFNRLTPEGKNLRGPTWWALRDYHRLYKQLGWDAAGVPSLQARTLFPNAGNIHTMSDTSPTDNTTLRQRQYLYSSIYVGDRVTLNPNVTDLGKIDEPNSGANSNLAKWQQDPAPIPRPVNCAASPYVYRVFLVFSFSKTTVTATPAKYNYGLNVTPVVVLHNPYNVKLKSTPPSGYSALALTFTEWNNWKFSVTQETKDSKGRPVTKSYSSLLSNYYALAGGGIVNESDMFRVCLDSFEIGPGEYKIYSPKAGYQAWSHVVTLENALNYNGGFADDTIAWTTLWPGWTAKTTDTFALSITTSSISPKSSNFRARASFACWPGDVINPATNSFDLYNKSSELTELTYRNISYAINGEAATLKKPLASFKEKTIGGIAQPGDVIAVIEVSGKTAGAFPLFSHSNPMAPVTRADGAGRFDTYEGHGYAGASPSYRLNVSSPSVWSGLIQSVTTPAVGTVPKSVLTYGGYTHGTIGGSTWSIHTEIPLVAPTSLGQYAHANFGMRDQQPLLCIGNSFSTPLLSDETKTYETNTAKNWTDYDASYLLNNALWDGFYLSGAAADMLTINTPAIAPQPSDPTESPLKASPYTTAEKRNLARVLDDFCGITVPDSGNIPLLSNPRFRLIASGQPARSAVGDYKRSATVLLNDGAFNVNSTSVEAWTAFLGSAKKLAYAQYGSGLPTATSNARFPRAQKPGTTSIATGAMDDPSNWQGFCNLSDDQIKALAKAIVKENKSRFQILSRTERDYSGAINAPTNRLFRGLSKAATPYLGLAEFINRFLINSTPWASHGGALQAAIYRVDNPPATTPLTPSAGLTDRLTKSYTLGMISKSNLQTASLLTAPASSLPSPPTAYPPFVNPTNIESYEENSPTTNRTHAAMGTPGNLLQSDLLQSLGSAMATRSDTFLLRVYGEASSIEGAIGKNWIEAVVQRLPEFIDPADAPETPLSSVTFSVTNKSLGRRFKIISYRHLKPDEI